MLESHLESGNQSLTLGEKASLTYGVNITDKCLALEDTLPLLDQLAEAARARR